jgi:hypothetical protein
MDMIALLMSSLFFGLDLFSQALIADYLEIKGREFYKFRSILQTTSIIGYCMLPIALMSVILAFLPDSTPGLVKLFLIVLGLGWSTFSCVMVMGSIVSETRKYLCVYPIFLFYIFLSWYSIVS